MKTRRCYAFAALLALAAILFGPMQAAAQSRAAIKVLNEFMDD